ACCTETYKISPDTPTVKFDNHRTMADTHSLAFNRFELVRSCLQSKQYYCIKVNDRHILLHRNSIKSNGSGWSLELPPEIISRSFGTKQMSNIDAVLVNHQLDEHLYDIIVFPDKSASIVNRDLEKSEVNDDYIMINEEDDDIQIVNYCAPPQHPSSPVREQQSTINDQMNKQDEDNDSSYNSFIQDFVSPMTSPCYAEFNKILESFDKEEIQQLPPPSPLSSPSSFKETQNLEEMTKNKSSRSFLSRSRDSLKNSSPARQLRSPVSKSKLKRSFYCRKTFTPVRYSKRKIIKSQSSKDKSNDTIITKDENKNEGIVLSPELVSNALITMNDTLISCKPPTSSISTGIAIKETVQTGNVALILGEEMSTDNNLMHIKSTQTYVIKVGQSKNNEENQQHQKCKLPLYTAGDLSWLSNIGIKTDYIHTFAQTLDNYQKSARTSTIIKDIGQAMKENGEQIAPSISERTSITVYKGQQESEQQTLQCEQQLSSQLSVELINNVERRKARVC
ncbi:unnamed protein product, partial [Didymodactylos carnosus]